MQCHTDTGGGPSVTIDRRFHDAVLFDFDEVVTDTATPSGGIRPVLDSTIALARRLRDLGVNTATYSISATCEHVLTAAGLSELFTVVACGGGEFAPLSDVARQMGARPNRCVLILGACEAIAAASMRGYGLVVGVARRGDEAQFYAAGADVVVNDVAAIDLRTGDHRMSALPSALDSMAQLNSVLSGRIPAVFLDFDGTLADIVDEPAKAALVKGAAAALRSLSEVCPVAIISGRQLSDVRTKVGIPELWYAGAHGIELLSPDGRVSRNEIADRGIPSLASARDELRAALEDIPGALVEDKQVAVAVHYRMVAAERSADVAAAARIVGRRHHLNVTQGRKVIELHSHVRWDKGDAVNWILDRLGSADTLLPLYIGDDLTDEDGLDVVKRHGIGIIVRHAEDGDRCSAAQFALEAPAQVAAFLARLAVLLSHTVAPDTSDWSVSFDGYRPESERLREVLCAVGNGYMATRAAAPDSRCGSSHYPGTYAAGVYNRLTDTIDGVTVSNESIVNLPNWLPLTFRIDNGPWFDTDAVNLLSYRQTIEIKNAECRRSLTFQGLAGRRTTMTQRLFVSMANPHIAALQMTVVAENWSGTMTVRSMTDAGVTNSGVQRYQQLSGQHLRNIAFHDLGSGGVLVDAQTLQSRIPIAVATRTSVWRDNQPAQTATSFEGHDTTAGYNFTTEIVAGEPITVDKIAAVFTGRDRAISVPGDAAETLLPELGRYDELRERHCAVWAQLWPKFDFGIPHSVASETTLRLHIMHLLQSISGYTADVDAGVPARGLHGEAYRGHIFWDELFIVPLLTLRLPQVSRSLLGYRNRRLPQARHTATTAGYAGAMYPWQSGSSGREESQQLHLNPLSGRWNTDSSHLAHHIGSAVAYNVWHYYQITGNRQYLIESGAEVILEIARFWSSRAHFDTSRHRYVINGVIGPDEFHSGYPDKPHRGVDNNAYTNVMAVWVILRAFDTLDALPLPDRLDILGKLQISGAELAQWDSVSRNIFVPFHDGVISQFEGYERLLELDWPDYRSRYQSIGRLDRILESENDDVNHYKVAKQADVLMLFYLLSSDELRELFARLGYHFLPQQIPATIDYYAARTSHGSTLSAVVHSWVSARGDRGQAMQYFHQVLRSDVADIQGGSTTEGVHLAAMAGSVDLLQRCFTGLETRGDRLILGPMWPESEGNLECSLWYRGHRLHLVISGRTAEVTADPTGAPSIEVECRGRIQRLASGQTIRIG